MKAYVQAQWYHVWKFVKTGYTESTTSPTNDASKKLYDSNAKARNDILNGLTEFVYVKVMLCTSAKDIWDMLQKIY